MCAGKLEAYQVVIEGRRQPAIGVVTCPAIRAKLTIMGIILLMAGVTILFSGL